MDEILSQLGAAKFFSTMDLTDAFWSILIREEDIGKTAFITQVGLWEFVFMPFGLCNAPAMQQRFMESILTDFVTKCWFVYINDILINSQTFTEHLTDINEVFTVLQKNNLMVTAMKCNLCKPMFEILSFVATPEGLKMDKNKLDVIRQYPKPVT